MVKEVLPEQVDGKNILPIDPDPDLQSRRESTIPDDDDYDDTIADDASLSDNGIRGTQIFVGKFYLGLQNKRLIFRLNVIYLKYYHIHKSVDL